MTLPLFDDSATLTQMSSGGAKLLGFGRRITKKLQEKPQKRIPLEAAYSTARRSVPFSNCTSTFLLFDSAFRRPM
jgi:hypothetical protein